ncbi:PP2C family protein-serine/threonine phosphatase [Modestobacter altitudinis]|uniref:PP2C family protein-serine/threonine phosphatase n=1 Tax=Modestobacter altitudinis TaxID=2213158 RepID=UPI001C551C63|nr:SpoIIE family protein phosphatase [Modestobacter altitudinis]
MPTATESRAAVLTAVDELARLRSLEMLDVLRRGPEERFDRITRMAQQLFGVSAAAVTLVTDRVQVHKSQHGPMALGDGPREAAFCDHTIRDSAMLVVEDATEDERFATNPSVVGSPHIRFYAGQPLEGPGGHRVGALCLVDDRPRHFSEAEQGLLAELASWVQRELDRTAELDSAARVQQALLPRRVPEVAGYEVAGMCLPAGSVGGDFFDWYHAPDGQLVVTLADVMGKGLPASIIMATVRAVMRSTTRDGDPGQALTRAAATLHEDLERTGRMVTLCHARLDTVAHELHYADAGHGLMLLVRADGSAHRPQDGGLPLGVLPDQTWTEQVVQLQPGDTAIAFSDGLLDLYDGTLDSLEQIADVVRDCVDATHLVDRFTVLARRLGVRVDDVTVVAVRRTT